MSVDKYLKQLTEQEKHVLEIAKDHLGDSFDIERSIGFQEWIQTQKATQKATQEATQKATQKATIIKKKKLRIKKKKSKPPSFATGS